MRRNPGKTMTIYDTPTLLNKAYVAACVPNNIPSDFKSTEIFLFSRTVFSDACFAPVKTVNRYLPSENDFNTGSASQVGEDNQLNDSTPCVFQ